MFEAKPHGAPNAGVNCVTRSTPADLVALTLPALQRNYETGPRIPGAEIYLVNRKETALKGYLEKILKDKKQILFLYEGNFAFNFSLSS